MRRRRPLATSRAALPPANIVHLHTEQMADAVGHEPLRHPGIEQLPAVAAADSEFEQQVREFAERGKMQFHIIAPRTDLGDKLPLQPVHAGDEFDEQRMRLCRSPGSGHIGAIAAGPAAGVDQQHPGRPRKLPPLVLVMERGRFLVDGDDRRVGQLLLDLPAGFEKGEVDVELAAAGEKAQAGGFVARRGEAVGGAHPRRFIGRLDGPGEIEAAEQRRGIAMAFGDAEFLREARIRPQVGRVPAGPRQVAGAGQSLDVERLAPRLVEREVLLVPVVRGNDLVVDRFSSGPDEQELVGPVDRQPVAEMPEGLKSDFAVIGEIVLAHATVEQNTLEAAGHRLFVLTPQPRHMGRIAVHPAHLPLPPR